MLGSKQQKIKAEFSKYLPQFFNFFKVYNVDEIS